MSEQIDLSGIEHRVLGTMYDLWGEEFAGGFREIAGNAGLTRAQVRDACRSLRAKGLARFHRFLMTDEGQLGGSGYSLTRKAFDHGWLEGGALAELESSEASRAHKPGDKP